jgi:hypothetical protein
MEIIFQNIFTTSQKTRCDTITETNHMTMFSDVIVVFSKNVSGTYILLKGLETQRWREQFFEMEMLSCKSRGGI